MAGQKFLTLRAAAARKRHPSQRVFPAGRSAQPKFPARLIATGKRLPETQGRTRARRKRLQWLAAREYRIVSRFPNRPAATVGIPSCPPPPPPARHTATPSFRFCTAVTPRAAACAPPRRTLSSTRAEGRALRRAHRCAVWTPARADLRGLRSDRRSPPRRPHCWCLCTPPAFGRAAHRRTGALPAGIRAGCSRKVAHELGGGGVWVGLSTACCATARSRARA